MHDSLRTGFALAQMLLIMASFFMLRQPFLGTARRWAAWILGGTVGLQILDLAIRTGISLTGPSDHGINYPLKILAWEYGIRGVVEFLVFAMVGGVLFFTLAKIRRFKNGIILMNEQEVMATTVNSVAVGWPAVFIFLGLVFILAVLWMLVLVLLRRRTLQDRLEVAPAIVPAAVITFLLRTDLLAWTGLAVIRV